MPGNGWMDGRGCTDGHGWMNGRGCMPGNGWMDGCGWLRMGGWMAGWTDGCGWMDGRANEVVGMARDARALSRCAVAPSTEKPRCGPQP
eukprot:195074-Chlamydomonas_euryale.AAC.1